MKAKHSVWKTKLVKTTFFMTVILVAALFIGSAASAGITSQTTPKLNAKKEKYSPEQFSTTGLFSSQCPPVTAGSSPMTPTPKGDVIFSQAPMDPYGYWNFYTSADDFPYVVADDFVVADSIGDIHWYGCALIWDSGWYVGDPTGMTFEIKFYEQGTGGTPGAEVATFSDVAPEAVETGQVYSWIGTSYYWEVVLDYSVDLTEGWVSIQSTSCPDGSVFLWLNSPDGDFDGVQEQSGSWVLLYDSLAFDLTAPDIQLEHDIAVTKITAPNSGNAAPIVPIVTVMNKGLYTEYGVDIEMEISKIQISGQWTQEESTEWRQSNTNYAGGTAPEAYLPYSYITGDYAYLMSCPVDTSSYSSLTLYFRSMINNYAGGYNCYIKSRSSPSDAWTDVTPWVNPITASIPADRYSVDVTSDISTTTQVMFEFSGYYWNLNYWYIDDFELGSYNTDFSGAFPPTGAPSYITDYPATIVTIPQIDPEQVIDVVFPEWTPADLLAAENVDIPYFAEATNLFPDEKIGNDYKSKEFALHFGYLNDVKVNEIVSPIDSVAEPQTPEVIIENVGQLDQTAMVNMVISKIQYGAQWYQEQHSGQGVWERDTSSFSTPPGSGAYMMADSDGHSGWTYDVSMYTASMDMTGETSVTLSFGAVFWDLGYDDVARVSILSGGVSQGDAYYLSGTDDYGSIVTYTFDPSVFPDPSDVQVEFYYTTGAGTWDWGFGVDDVLLVGSTTFIDWNFENPTFPPAAVTLVPEYDSSETVAIAAGEVKNVVFDEWVPVDLPVLMNIDYKAEVEVTLGGFTSVYNYGFEEAWIPAVPPGPVVFPPAGWNVYNVNGDTILWSQYASGAHSGTYCASIGYHYPTNDDWLVTKPVIVPSGGGVFSFWWKCGSTYYAEHFKIYYSTSGNTVADFTGPNGYVIGDITYNADTLWHQFTYTMTTPEQVWFAVYCDSADALRLSVDDFAFPDGTTQGFDEGTPGVPGHWPSFNQFIYGTTTDQWFPVTSGSYPTCSPPEGIYMAEYNSWNIYSGNAAELDGTVLIDFTTATTMTFQMYHNTGYVADDVIYPLLSADGVNFWYDGTGFYQYDGTTGWKTETMDYSLLINYLGGPGYYYIGFYAVSDYGYNMFMDDIKVGYYGEIPDGNPSDNFMDKQFTLSYIHDVGVIEITEPSGPAKADIIWDNYGDDGTGNGLSSQLDQAYPFNSQCADDFQFAASMDINTVHWWGTFWNGAVYPNPCEFNIIFYADDGTGTMPTGAGSADPTYTALAVYNYPAVTGTSYGTNQYEYEVPISPAFVADANTKYWIAIQAVCEFSTDGQWGWSTNGDSNPEQLSGPVQGFPLLGTDYWTATTYGDHAFQLGGGEHQGGGGNWEPGTYPVAGIIGNLGVTYTEADIPVNAQITNDTGVVVYDETIIVAGPLAPGEIAMVTFPDIVIPEDPDAEGDYKLTMQTTLSIDEVPSNNKKTKTWIIQIPDTTPPTTTATVSGTMGDEGWYVSNVQVTLAATDGKWPTGVNYTMYKVDNGNWTEYETPIVVSTDGPHTVYFYSVDNADNEEEQQNVSFKIDKTAPVINEFTATAQNAMKNKYLLECDAEDPMSGIVLVEFYADDALVGSVTAEPYEFLVEAKIGTAQCIVYDAAGNSKMSDVVTAYTFEYQQYSLLQQKIL